MPDIINLNPQGPEDEFWDRSDDSITLPTGPPTDPWDRPVRPVPVRGAIPPPGRIQLRCRIRPIHGVTPRKALHHTLYLPLVVGDNFEVSQESPINDFTTIGGGEYSQNPPGKRNRMLRSFDLSTMTMVWSPNWMTYKGQRPSVVARALRRLLDYACPFHLVAVVGGHHVKRQPEYDDPATLRSLTRRITSGEADTHYFDLSFREHRHLHVKRRRHGNPPLPIKYRLRAGDTLRSLATHYYGNGGLWREIAVANGVKVWGSEDELIRMSRFKVGTPVVIPELPEGPPIGLAASPLGDEEDSSFLRSTEDV